MIRQTAVLMALLVAPALARADESESLRGSRASMIRQNAIALENDFSFLRSGREIEEFVEAGRLVPLEGNENYTIDGASYPVARPEVKLLVERLSEQHRAACGQRLVVTSLTRPLNEQPGNAHQLSVHPAGMAVDLRVSNKAACRTWLEQTLLSLENRQLLDVTREFRPPHYHVAVFPEAYRAYVENLLAEEKAAAFDAVAREARETATTIQLAPAPAPVKASAVTPDRIATLLAAVALVVAFGLTHWRGRARAGR